MTTLALLQASDGTGVGRTLPRRSLVFDLLIALIFTSVGYLLLKVLSPRSSLDDSVFVAVVSLPLAIRRRLPKTAFLLVFGVSVVQMLLRVPIGIYDAALLFGLYSVVGYTNRRFGLAALGLAMVGVVVGAITGWWGYVDRQLAAPTLGLRFASTLGAFALLVAAWGLGERLRSARLGLLALADRALRLEREREQQAIIAAAAERTRIAREMHDVVAHGLSVMIVQADGAAYVVEESPAVAKTALEQISATGRQSLAEMRNLLGLLRSGAGAGVEGPAAAAQPDLAALEGLLAEARTAGATVALERPDHLAGIPAMVSLTAYRIVQESLTNARKHGGDRVQVIIERTPGGLRIVVRDNGRASELGSAGEPGHGLVGMRERAVAVGGQVEAGAVAGGGFEVVATLPI